MWSIPAVCSSAERKAACRQFTREGDFPDTTHFLSVVRFWRLLKAAIRSGSVSGPVADRPLYESKRGNADARPEKL